jgi:hypothetical protein
MPGNEGSETMASGRQTKGRAKKATQIRDLSVKAKKSGRVEGGSSVRKKESDSSNQDIGKI